MNLSAFRVAAVALLGATGGGATAGEREAAPPGFEPFADGAIATINGLALDRSGERLFVSVEGEGRDPRGRPCVHLAVRERAGDDWAPPRPWTEANGPGWELSPTVSPDGRWFLMQLEGTIWRAELSALVGPAERRRLVARREPAP